MLVSFTQTYGTGRDELLDIYFKDKRLLEFKNLFDLNIYSFHNCEKSTIDKFKEMSKGIIKNSKVLEFNNDFHDQWVEDGYTGTIRKLKEYLRNIGCTHFFFSQDDTFSSIDNKGVNWKELVDYIKEYDRDFMISLFNTKNSLDCDGFNSLMEEKRTFEIYKTTTIDFADTLCFWPMDDSPFICTMDILEEVYDEDYLNYPIICIAEKHLRDKYTTKKINRFVANKRFFRNYNIHGPNSGMKTMWRNILKRNGLL
jgi:hypothetical protein